MKTSYFSKADNVPGAISIARFPPKWSVAKKYPRLAPTPDLIHVVDMVQYSRLYTLRVLARLDPEEVYEELVDIADPYEPILLCFEKDRNDCHRAIVADWFERYLDVKVKEYGSSNRDSSGTVQMELF